MRTCKCGNESRAEDQAYCNDCHAEYMRSNRRKYSELSEYSKKKANARSYANAYKRRGKIREMPCEICGGDNSEMHHEDYDKPLDIKWLCRLCHLDHHSLVEVSVCE